MTGRLVGLHGLPQVGKDQIAKFLCHRGWVRVSFADPIREAIYVLNPIISEAGDRLRNVVDRIGWDAAKANFPEVRVLLQRFGTDVGRDMWDQRFWLDKAIAKIRAATSVGASVVVTDVRLPNEAEFIAGEGGLIYEVVRDGVPPPNSHSSNRRLAERFIFGLIRNPVAYGDDSRGDAGVAELNAAASAVILPYVTSAPD